jgi:uncharacterized protein
MLRTPIAALLVVPLACGSAIAAEKHKLALQISDNDPDKMNAVLNVAANVSKFYSYKRRRGRYPDRCLQCRAPHAAR